MNTEIDPEVFSEISQFVTQLDTAQRSVLGIFSLLGGYKKTEALCSEASAILDISEQEIEETLKVFAAKNILQFDDSKEALRLWEPIRSFIFKHAIAINDPEALRTCVENINEKSISFDGISDIPTDNADYLFSLICGQPDDFYYSKINGIIPSEGSKLCNPAAFFDADLIAFLPEVSQLEIFKLAHRLCVLFGDQCFNEDSAEKMYCYFSKAKWLKSDLFLKSYSHLMAEHFMLDGKFERAKNYVEMSSSPEAEAIKASVLFFFHGCEAALSIFKEALKNLRSTTGKNSLSFSTVADWLYFVSLMHEGSQNSISEAVSHKVRISRRETSYPQIYRILYCLYTAKNTADFNPKQLMEEIGNSKSILDKWFGCFTLYWLGISKEFCISETEKLAELVSNQNMELVYCELLRLLDKFEIPLSPKQQEDLKNWNSHFTLPLADMIQKTPKWETVLTELTKELNLEGTYAQTGNSRLVWEFVINSSTSFEVKAREQTRLKSGNWSSGRIIDCSRYIYGTKPYPEFVTEQDKRIMDHFREFNPWHVGNRSEDWEIFKTMIGHPSVYHSGDLSKPVDVLKGEPILVMDEETEGYTLKFMPEYDKNAVFVENEGDYTIRVYSYTPLQIKAAEIISKQDVFPFNSINKLKTIFKALGNIMPVHTGIAEAGDLTSTASITADSRIYARLVPGKDNLTVKLVVKPFGKQGPAMLPYAGHSDVFATISGQKLHTKRNQKQEEINFNLLKESCPSLASLSIENPTVTYPISEDSLQVLYELQDSDAVLEWPKNAKQQKIMKIKFSDMRFVVSKHNEWFELNGELQIGEDRVIELKQLLSMYDGSGKFIALSKDEFIAITDELKKRLDDLKAYTEKNGDELMFHSLALPAMEEFFGDTPSVTFDKAWRDAVVRVKKADKITFEPADNLKDILRDYQSEGFRWLSRMAYLGMGACLADDMGLGKTLEALSIIQARSSEGPTFVLAPTSVCTNWLSECKRFTPGLNPIMFASSDRAETIKNLAPNDLIICSYGILQKEIESLENVNWATVVLDEAQAIKNMSTGRSQAAMRLRGGFKMLMTGTPIENHLGELWNLFRFLNPGLLGTLDRFNEKFANPIQVEGNAQAGQRLKSLVQPFILRRTKNQVLKNLPPRTEITLRVDLSEQEAALYENFRRSAVDTIKNDQNSNKSIIVLAEIMKLRRLCCNPDLVAPELGIKSSKLSLLESIASDLHTNGHKALIFSQFVDHLSIVRKLFDSKGFTYKYLDGTTPVKQRTKAIEGFQNGEADFFLISLRAGGLGLNLTAADYVIHLDPWWNPAVEDQASDRAHRLGQTKPVTIYKLITTNTIEEKIVQLHGKKRGLADDLLKGSDLSGRISTRELFALISKSAFSSD